MDQKIWLDTHKETNRAWLYFYDWVFSIEASFFKRTCHLSFGISEHGDRNINWSIAIPFLFALYWGVQIPRGSKLRSKLPQKGEFNLSIYAWTIRLALWEDPWSWTKSDYWWSRGVSFNIPDFFFGRLQAVKEIRSETPITINLDGHRYKGTAKIERWVRWRPRIFAKCEDCIWISMNPGHGLPHSGKGENSWDCGDDALCGWGHNGTDIQAAIQHGINSVNKYREKYGKPSEYGPKEIIKETNDNTTASCETINQTTLRQNNRRMMGRI